MGATSAKAAWDTLKQVFHCSEKAVEDVDDGVQRIMEDYVPDDIGVKFSKMISLNGTNYHIWRNKMKDLLFVTIMHLSMFTTVKPDGKTDEEWDFEHEQVCGFIRQFVEGNVYNYICNETHARTLWNKLE
ncbi:hypothetical protein JRO89_XSUnG0011200 [Xanthoceras sorbifolium]|uniref:Gag-pol polyprotein n=1 Tax=Xanthoceras sorbifolium TaxID=99658 RepID=A0ABQ8H0E6_9ROSI|nr:hypothetical protein JRO89_XSUnG0011200 [Xanthoceras sorbifolium]